MLKGSISHRLLSTTSSLRRQAPSARWRLLRGKTAAITGGTTGIGRAIALEYLRQGANVAINHLGLERDEKHVQSLLEEHGAIREERVVGENTSKAGELLEIVGDVTDPDAGTALVNKAVEQWGKLDIFVANAGVFKAAEFLTLVSFYDASIRADRAIVFPESSLRQLYASTWGELSIRARLLQGRW